MPTPPVVFAYPIKRPGFITGATWTGNVGDAQLSLSLEYVDQQGLAAQTTLYTTPHSDNPGATLCLPTSKVITDLSDDLLTSHLRMAGMISGTIPGSDEYAAAIKGDGVLSARYFQSPIGDIKVTSIASISPRTLRVTWQKVSGGIFNEVDCDIADLATYAFAPSTQLLVIAGAIKKQFSSYVHDDATGKHLTQAQMDAIAAYVLGLDPWI